MNLGIIDYGVGNITNVIRAFYHANNTASKSENIANFNAIKIQDSNDIKGCDKLVLPGVGAFGVAMENIIKNGFLDSINDFIKSGKYMLGICLGMQLLFEKSSEFGTHKGLGLIEGEVIKFGSESNKSVKYLDSIESLSDCSAKPLGSKGEISNTTATHHIKPLCELSKKTQNLKIPHIGWNLNTQIQKSNIFNHLKKEFFLYFVHSYHAVCDKKYILALCDYGISFPSIVNKNNIFGIQPHPEKSHAQGLQILQNFLNL